MGAVPKKKPSLRRTRTRRSVWASKFTLPNLIKCDNCQKAKLPHRTCRQCGFYRGKPILSQKTVVKKIM